MSQVDSPSGFGMIADLVRGRTGLTFSPSRLADAERATRRAMERAGTADGEAYLAALESGRAALDDLVAELLVHETYFFREPAHFVFLRGTILPELGSARGPGHVHAIWSAGCASGEEAYSLAIALEEAGLGGRSSVLGTDLSGAMLDRARRGRYRAWSLRGVDDARVHGFLRVVGDEMQIDAVIRSRVTFEPHNLAGGNCPRPRLGPASFDVIFCRNVLVYFDRETVRGVARRLFDALAPGGWLITAGTNPPLGADAPFEIVVTEAGVFYRRPPMLASVPAAAPWRLSLAGSPDDDSGRETPPVRPAAEPAPVLAAPPDLSTEASAAFAAGDWPRVVALASRSAGDPALAALGVRAAANIGVDRAARECAAAAARHPLSVELHYLLALLHTELGQPPEAADAARRVVYLDRSLAAGHFVLGSALRRAGDLAAAARAYRNARDLAAARPPDELVPLTEGERAGRLAAAAAAQLASLESALSRTTPEIT